MLKQHLPILLVIVPLITAPLIVLLRRPLLSWMAAMLASVVTLIIAIPLLQQAVDQGVISYAIGTWPAPLGIRRNVRPSSSQARSKAASRRGSDCTGAFSERGAKDPPAFAMKVPISASA